MVMFIERWVFPSESALPIVSYWGGVCWVDTLEDAALVMVSEFNQLIGQAQQGEKKVKYRLVLEEVTIPIAEEEKEE